MRRPPIIAFATLVAVMTAPGCTHVALQRQTVNQARTLLDLQYQQVLDNLAMFACNHDALPSQVRIKGGLVQVTDLGSAAITGAAGGTGDLANSLSPSVSGQRTTVDQWELEPVIDDDDLEALRLAYVNAVETDTDKLKDLKIDIRKMIWKLALEYDFDVPEYVLFDILCDGIESSRKKLLRKLYEDNVEGAGDQPRNAEMAIKKAYDSLLAAVQVQFYTTAKDSRKEGDPMADPNLGEFRSQIALARHFVGAIIEALQRPDSPSTSLGYLRLQLDYMADFPSCKRTPNENLPLMIAHLFPSISEDLEERRKCKEKPGRKTRAGCVPKFKPRFNEKYSPAIQLFIYIDAHPDYYLTHAGKALQLRNPGLADQAIDKVSELRKLLDPEKREQWFGCGSKSDVPKCACYVGRYCGCGCECYVWVAPEGMKDFREFTLSLLDLAPAERQDTLTSIGRGAAFSPGH